MRRTRVTSAIESKWAECRPISKTKSWILTRVIEKAIGSE